MSYDLPTTLLAPKEVLDCLLGADGTYSFENVLPSPCDVWTFLPDGSSHLSHDAHEWRERAWGTTGDITFAKRISDTELLIETYWSLPLKAVNALFGGSPENGCVNRVVRLENDGTVITYGFDTDVWRKASRGRDFDAAVKRARREFKKRVA